ncbi:MAG: L-ribulose-5-phosphate 4-epimerase AraD [Desulfobacteraceae bacterium]
MSKHKELKEKCWKANMEVSRQKLAVYTFGNVSALNPEEGIFAIKPSGVPYDEMKPADMVLVDLDGKKVEGKMNPSSDTPTHAVLYRSLSGIYSIVHTHSAYAAAWAQACRPVPIYGTTHADHLAGDIPVTEVMSDEMIKGQYEEQTGHQIINALKEKNLSPLEVQMILVACHGAFTWGETPDKAVYNAVVLEEIARMAFMTEQINPDIKRMKETLINKHYQRKHGKDAYYGQ